MKRGWCEGGVKGRVACVERGWCEGSVKGRVACGERRRCEREGGMCGEKAV